MAIKSDAKTSDVYFIPADSPRTATAKKSFWHVDREMLRFKIHFFLFIGAQGAAIPYIVVFAKERLGLAAASLGSVLTTQMFLFVVFKPLTGYIADYFNRLKTMICLLTVINVSGYFLLLAIPKHELAATATFSDHHFGVTDLCHDYSLTLHSVADFNVTETSTQSETCHVCLVNYGCFLNVLEQYNLTSETLQNHSFDDKVTDGSKKISVILCKRNCSLNLVLCNDDFKSSLESYSVDTKAESLQHSTECNGKSSDNPLCSTFSCQSTEDSDTSYTKQNMPEIYDSAGNPRTVSNFQDGHTSYTEQNMPEGHDSAGNPITVSNFQDSHTSYTEQNMPEGHDSAGNPRTVSDFQTLQFWGFAFLYTLSSVTANAIFTLSDTACCESIQKSGADFGRQRLWGAIGWGAVAPFAGFLNDYTQNFLTAFILMAVMLLLFLWNLFKLDLVKPHFSQNILRDVGTVLRSKEFLSFELAILMNGISLGIVWFYLILFLRSIGGSELLCGLCLTVQSFGGSIPFMFYSGWIIRKIGHFHVLMLALFTNVIRFLWYSYLRNPVWALPVEVTHGITYGLYYTALASYGKLSAKPGTEATTQSILFSTNEGLGCGLGCIFAGIGFDYFGGHRTFFITGMFSVCGFIISLVLSFLVIGRQNRTIPITRPQGERPSNDSRQNH